MGVFKYLLNNKYSYADRIFDPLEGKTICRWLLMLPGAGCSWAKQKSGGCHMCGFKHETRKYSLGLRLPAFVFTKLFDEGYQAVKGNNPELLAIFNGGSFLNDQEIRLPAQIKICERAGRVNSIKKVLIESRPEYVTADKVKQLISCLGGKKLIVGIGLECASDETRKSSINKGFTRRDYEKAVNILKDTGSMVVTYIFLKPIYLSENQAIEEAVESARYAFAKGSDYVIFNSALVQKGTKMEELYLKGEFTPPWLWSVVEVARRTHKLGPIRIGDFNDEPTPIASPKNCERCTPLLLDLFKRYKETHDITIFENTDCDCKRDWEEILQVT